MGRPEGGGRPTPISFFELDVRWLKRRGYLVSGAVNLLVERINGHCRGEVMLRCHDDDLELIYGRRSQYVAFAETAQPFGGRRQWLECLCGNRAAIIYGPPFRCRSCHGIAYRSQREGARYRSLRKAQKMRMRLGGTASMSDAFPEKPKGLHWRTYYRAWAKSLEIEGRHWATAASRLGIGERQ